jgi:hypothetical protein
VKKRMAKKELKHQILKDLGYTYDSAFDEIKAKKLEEGQSEEQAEESAGKILSAAKGKDKTKKKDHTKYRTPITSYTDANFNIFKYLDEHGKKDTPELREYMNFIKQEAKKDYPKFDQARFDRMMERLIKNNFKI